MERLIFPDIFRPYVTAFFTGKSPGADVRELGRLLKIRGEDIFMPIQKHTDKVLILESSREPKIADAVVTSERGVLLGVQVADCVPILIYDKGKGVSGAVHAGWRGTAEGILKKTLAAMARRFSCRAEDVLLAVGPSIRGCCYEVGYEVVHKISLASGGGEYYRKTGEKYYLDLSAANRMQALSWGVREESIWISPDCTFSNPEKYCSYRFAKGHAGRQGGFVGKI
jgi:YfiH family protein